MRENERSDFSLASAAERDVTSTTPGRILKGRDRNVHESIPAAVRPVASEVRSLE